MSAQALLKRILVVLRSLSVLTIVLIPGSFSKAQTNKVEPADLTRVRGPEDRDVPVPEIMTPYGQLDSTALQEIIDFLKATNGAGWKGMQGTGIFSVLCGESGDYPARLTVRGGEAFSLDADTPQGKFGVRIEGANGQVLEAVGQRRTLPASTARHGVVAFPKILAREFPSQQTSVFDRGLHLVDGKQLHRITIEEPLSTSLHSFDPISTSVVDLYFDPASHLLVRSAALARLDDQDRSVYLQTITYLEYRKVDGMLLPFSYRQSMNGQPQWLLKLADIQLNPSFDESIFHF